MPTQTDNPEALSKLNSFDITSELQSFANDLFYDIDTEKQKRAWWDSVTDEYINQRYGIRPKKDFPWPNCANYVIPLIDADINRLKPSYAGLIDVFPVVIFEPYGQTDIEAAEKKEIYFDWLLKAKMNFFENYMLGIDYLLEQGIVIWKITWKYSTRNYTVEIDLKEVDPSVLEALYSTFVTDDMLKQIFIEEFKIDDSHEENIAAIEKAVQGFREGKTSFELLLKETVDDQPEVVPCSMRYDVVFPVETTDLNNARFIDFRFQMSKNDLKIAMRDEKYLKYSNDSINGWATAWAADQKNRQRVKTVTTQPDEDMVWLHETCVWRDINDDGIDERCIITWPHGKPEDILRFIEMPYDHGMWPYVACKREINDPGYFSSRGIPALDADFQQGISTGFNQSVDNGTITNTPQIKYKENSVANIRNVRYVPGERVKITGSMDDYQVSMLGNPSQQYLLQSGQYLKAWANERIGNVSSGLSQVNNMAGQGQQGQKTAKEINVVEQMGSEQQSLDLQIFQNQMSKVYFQIDALDNQFGNQEEIEFVSDGQFQRLSRKEIQGKFKYVPNGRLDNSNPQLRAAKAVNMLKMFLNDPDVNQRPLKRWVMDCMDVKIASKLFKTDQQKQEEAAQAQQAQQAQKDEALKTTVGMKVIQDNLDVRKAALMVPIEGREYAPG
jgi:hypothetical protein